MRDSTTDQREVSTVESSECELEVDHERERTCGTCGERFEEWAVRDGRGPVFETVEYTCPNGHRGKEHYDRRGYLSQTLGIERSSVLPSNGRSEEGSR